MQPRSGGRGDTGKATFATELSFEINLCRAVQLHVGALLVHLKVVLRCGGDKILPFADDANHEPMAPSCVEKAERPHTPVGVRVDSAFYVGF